MTLFKVPYFAYSELAEGFLFPEFSADRVVYINKSSHFLYCIQLRGKQTNKKPPIQNKKQTQKLSPDFFFFFKVNQVILSMA